MTHTCVLQMHQGTGRHPKRRVLNCVSPISSSYFTYREWLVPDAARVVIRSVRNTSTVADLG